MNNLICWLFGHRVDIENNPRPAQFFFEKNKEWVLKCIRCGFKEGVYKSKQKHYENL